MEELKLKNRQLEEENAMLKAKMIEMGQFSKRIVEITAEMDYLLNQRAKEIEKLKQEINSSIAIDPDSQISTQANNEIADFTMELDVTELTQIKGEPIDQMKKTEVIIEENEDGRWFICPYTDICTFKTRHRGSLSTIIFKGIQEKNLSTANIAECAFVSANIVNDTNLNNIQNRTVSNANFAVLNSNLVTSKIMLHIATNDKVGR